MATFHSTYWGEEAASAVVERAGLQPIGSYWHLDTRPDEHSSMPRGGLSGRLKLAARAIDRRLKSEEWQCLIHGDPKDANILVDDGGAGSGHFGRVYLYDFQYCGKGPPTKDLAYFLCSSVDDSALDIDSLIQYYHRQLESEIRARHSSQSSLSPPSGAAILRIPTLKELHGSLDLAFCDYYRFLCGWGHWGSLNQVEERVRRTLDRLDAGTRLDSPEDYEEAIERAYGL
jgi:thiamine kinase-like enzyme